MKRILYLAMMIWLVGCGGSAGGGQAPAKPVVTISSPQSGSVFNVGDQVTIAFSVVDVKGVAQFELAIDGAPVRVEPINPPVNSFNGKHIWPVESAGSHVIEIVAFNVDDVASEPAQAFVSATQGGAAVTPTAVASDQLPTPRPVDPTPTPTLVVVTLLPPPDETIPPATATVQPGDGDQATATTLVRLNVRAGPGVDYPVVGRLDKGETVPIIGRDALANWWQINFPHDGGDRAWISASFEYVTPDNIDNVPIIETVAPPPPTATPAPASTDTPSPLKPVIYSFTADRYTIARGEEVTLRWDLEQAKVALLAYDGNEEGVVSPGQRVVSPDEDTTYRLIARNDAGDTVAELTIRVQNEALPTPPPVYEDGKIKIASGQGVDFDEGIIYDGDHPDVDFYWDGGQKQFFPRGGASGALLGRAYDEISLPDCLAASYDKPISGVDGSQRVTGCYHTDEDRYGKYYVSEWDLNANLTVIWLTWDYRD